MLPLVALLLPVLIMFLGFAVDLAFMQNSRLELRAATDAAARAGAIELAQSEDIKKARASALQMAARNSVAGKSLRLTDQDVEFGRSRRDNAGQWLFEPGLEPWNSVRVRGHRTAASPDGAVQLFFHSVYGGGDFEPEVTTVSTFLNVDVGLVLDRSGSMKGNKLRDLKDAVEVFLQELEKTDSDEQVALASYSTSSRLDETLTTDYAPIRKTVKKMNASGLTAIGQALYDGIDGVMGNGRRELAVPVIVLMTDGQHNRGVEPIVPARKAAAENITVHTITFGSGADFKRMRAVAEETGGRHYHAKNGNDLKDVFREIARSLPTQLTQ